MNQRKKMLFRFSLYGFLKNQQYYDPFLILMFRDVGLTFYQIGWLIGFREIIVNIMEVPSGAIADGWGRRQAMVLSFSSYITSFVVFYFSRSYWQFFVAMFCFAVGDAFRSGTHKALILSWLEQTGRRFESTRVYGYTRSWSKLGSALSVVISAGFVLKTGDYRIIFLLSIPPYIVNIINLATYPKELDQNNHRSDSVVGLWWILKDTFKNAFARKSIRGLLVESVCFQGTFKTLKDYVQPFIKQMVLGTVFLIAWETRKRTALLVGIVYVILYLVSAWASRHAHILVDKTGSELRSARWIWLFVLVCYMMMIPALRVGWMWFAVLIFIGLYISQNFFRPLMVSRFNQEADSETMATLLSLESQARTLTVMILAPLLGKAVDLWGFIAVGIAGCLLSAVGSLMSFSGRYEPR